MGIKLSVSVIVSVSFFVDGGVLGTSLYSFGHGCIGFGLCFGEWIVLEGIYI